MVEKLELIPTDQPRPLVPTLGPVVILIPSEYSTLSRFVCACQPIPLWSILETAAFAGSSPKMIPVVIRPVIRAIIINCFFDVFVFIVFIV
jgi:hypothetical protein